MTNEKIFLLAIAAYAIIAVVFMQVSKNRHRIKRVISDRFNFSSKDEQNKPHVPTFPVTESEPRVLTEEEKSKAELERVKKLIEDRKRIAREADISHHLWGLYSSRFQHSSPESLDRYIQNDEWYGLKILHVSSENEVNKFEFELKGARYIFVDDEEKQGWRVNMKLFSLFLYDDSDRCLIEIPMKMKVDKQGRNYSIMSNGPKAFIPGGWVKDFINVKLKHQRNRNQEIRAQKHQERLWEIEDLKERFGLWD